MRHRRLNFRAGRTPWAVLLFLLGFGGLIAFISFYYLFPALRAQASATPDQKRHLALQAWLLMLVMLVILFVGLMVTFRFGRFFFPRSAPPPAKTKYVDAWAESGKRM